MSLGNAASKKQTVLNPTRIVLDHRADTRAKYPLKSPGDAPRTMQALRQRHTTLRGQAGNIANYVQKSYPANGAVALHYQTIDDVRVVNRNETRVSGYYDNAVDYYAPSPGMVMPMRPVVGTVYVETSRRQVSVPDRIEQPMSEGTFEGTPGEVATFIEQHPLLVFAAITGRNNSVCERGPTAPDIRETIFAARDPLTAASAQAEIQRAFTKPGSAAQVLFLREYARLLHEQHRLGDSTKSVANLVCTLEPHPNNEVALITALCELAVYSNPARERLASLLQESIGEESQRAFLNAFAARPMFCAPTSEAWGHPHTMRVWWNLADVAGKLQVPSDLEPIRTRVVQYFVNSLPSPYLRGGEWYPDHYASDAWRAVGARSDHGFLATMRELETAEHITYLDAVGIIGGGNREKRLGYLDAILPKLSDLDASRFVFLMSDVCQTPYEWQLFAVKALDIVRNRRPDIRLSPDDVERLVANAEPAHQDAIRNAAPVG